MSDQKKYHTAIEIKNTVSMFLKHMDKIRSYVEDGGEEDLLSQYLFALTCCETLMETATEVAKKEKPPEREIKDPDRGINDFIEGSYCGCKGDCGDGCGGGCGGCSP